MVQAELFILFPEYVEGDQAATAPYLHTIDLLAEEEVEAYIGRFRDLIEFLPHENYTGYYDMKNIRAFSRPLEWAEECYPDKKRSLLAAIRHWENWREEATENAPAVYFHAHPVASDTLSEVAARKQTKEKAENTFLVVSNGAIDPADPEDGYLPVFNRKKENQGIEQRECRCDRVHDWFAENRRPARSYTYNQKHGEYGKGHRAKASPLLGSREEAAEMLRLAVGEAPHLPLFYYDKKYGKYIQFKYENTQANSYHAFHVEDNEVCHTLPKSVLKKIELILP